MKFSKDMPIKLPNIISIGDSGKGKTHFIGTMLTHNVNPFIIDSEGGLMSIKNKEFAYETVNNFTEFEEQVKWYFANYKKHNFNMLIVDSFSRLQQYLLDEKVKDGKANFDDWGYVLAKMRKVVDVLTKQCPTPLHFTCMASEGKDELTGMIKVYPNLQGAFKYDLCGYFDIVLYHDCGEDKNGKQKYWVQTQGDRRIVAKSRLQGLNKIEANDYSIIAKLIKENTNV